MVSKSMVVALPDGLGGRPVVELVQVASRYDSSIHIEADTKRVNAKSIMGLMTLDLGRGETVRVSAEGVDEENALAGIEDFLKGVRTGF